LGYTQADVADSLGIERASYGQIENGKNALRIEHLVRLPAILHRPVSYFLGLDDSAPMLDPDEAELLSLYRALPPALAAATIAALRAWAKPNNGVAPELAQPEAEPEPPEISDEKRAEYEQVIEDIDLYLAIDRATPEIREWALNFLIELRDRIQAQKAKEHGDALLYPTN
jgi:transcriptional regulator with XRE-family HTH domain